MIRNFHQVIKTVRMIPNNIEFQTFLERINTVNPCIQTRTDCIKKITMDDDDVDEQTDISSTSLPNASSEQESMTRRKTSQIYDLSNNWNKMFLCASANYSIMYFQGVRGLFLSVAVAIDSNLLLLSSNEQKQHIDDLCKQMTDRLQEYFEKFQYRSFGYIQSSMLQIFWQLDDRFQASIVHYLCDFLEINLLLIDSHVLPSGAECEGKYEWFAPLRKERKTVVCHKHGYSLWGTILASDFKSHLEIDLDFLRSILAPKVPVQPVPVTMTAEDETNLRKILQKMKLKDLQTKAIIYEISIESDTTGKSLLKKDLVDRMTKALSAVQALP